MFRCPRKWTLTTAAMYMATGSSYKGKMVRETLLDYPELFIRKIHLKNAQDFQHTVTDFKYCVLFCVMSYFTTRPSQGAASSPPYRQAHAARAPHSVTLSSIPQLIFLQ